MRNASKTILLLALAISLLLGAHASEPYAVTRAKALRAQAKQAEADLEASRAQLAAKLAEESPLQETVTTIEVQYAATAADQSSKKAALDQAKQMAELARQAAAQARQITREEREYYEDLESQAEEALFEETEASKDVAEAIARQNTTAVMVGEQARIMNESHAEATRAARSAARLNTTEAKAYQVLAYQVFLESKNILTAVNRQATRAVDRVALRGEEKAKTSKDKTETRGASDEQKRVKEKAERNEADAVTFHVKSVNGAKSADAALKVANAAVLGKLKERSVARTALNAKVKERLPMERTVAARAARANSMKGVADNAEKDAVGKGFKMD